MTEHFEKLDELEQEVLAFIRRRESDRETAGSVSQLSDELSDIAETWNALELVDQSEFAELAAFQPEPPVSERYHSGHATDSRALSGILQRFLQKLQPWLIPASTGLVTAGLSLFVLIPGYYGTPQEYITEPGDRLTISLDDGTSVLLYSGSQAIITEGWGRRKAELKSGTAFFTVTKSVEKPFQVISDHTTVTVLGTQFAVYHDSSITEVVVKEGKVNVKSAATTEQNPVNETLVKNQKIKIYSNLASELNKDINLDDELSWQKGVINFRNEKLSDIVKRLNHYYHKPIYIGSPALADMRFSGSFSVDDKQGFISSISVLKPVKVKEETNNTVLY